MKMKEGIVEGSPEEIRDFFQNNGLNIEDYIETPESPLKPIWLIIPTIIFIFAFSALTLLPPQSVSIQNFIFLIGCGAGIWLSVSVQIKFKNTWAAGFVAIGAVLIMLVAIGVITPKEMMQHLKEIRQ